MDNSAENKSIPAMPENLKRVYIQGFIDGRRVESSPHDMFIAYRATIKNEKGELVKYRISASEILAERLDDHCPDIEIVPFWPELNMQSVKKLEMFSLKPSGFNISPLLLRQPLQIECDDCKTAWTPIILSNGDLPDDWWKCPKGCNKNKG